MNVYSIHLSEPAVGKSRQPKLVLVKDGFSWAATAFGPLWALVLGLWETAALIFAVQLAAGFLITQLIPGPSAQFAAEVGVALCIGIVAGELRRWNLSRRGMIECASVLGLDAVDAERRYLEDNPQMVSLLKPAPEMTPAPVGEN